MMMMMMMITIQPGDTAVFKYDEDFNPNVGDDDVKKDQNVNVCCC